MSDESKELTQQGSELADATEALRKNMNELGRKAELEGTITAADYFAHIDLLTAFLAKSEDRYRSLERLSDSTGDLLLHFDRKVDGLLGEKRHEPRHHFKRR